MDAVVIVDPVQYQRRRDERDGVSMPLRSLYFGPEGGGLVTFLVYPPGDLVHVVKIQRLELYVRPVGVAGNDSTGFPGSDLVGPPSRQPAGASAVPPQASASIAGGELPRVSRTGNYG
jgi:hypothetical protein